MICYHNKCSTLVALSLVEVALCPLLVLCSTVLYPSLVELYPYYMRVETRGLLLIMTCNYLPKATILMQLVAR